MTHGGGWACKNALLPTLSPQGNIAFFPMSIGDHVTIGPKSIVCAAQIGDSHQFSVLNLAGSRGAGSRSSGSCVDIGENCVISKRCILKDAIVGERVLQIRFLRPSRITP